MDEGLASNDGETRRQWVRSLLPMAADMERQGGGLHRVENWLGLGTRVGAAFIERSTLDRVDRIVGTGLHNGLTLENLMELFGKAQAENDRHDEPSSVQYRARRPGQS